MKTLIPIMASILLLMFWCVQFFKLMRMKSEDFPSREDKSIWAISMIFLSVFGALLFWVYFKPKYEVAPIPPADINLYEETKTRFPSYQSEIDLALKLPSYERRDLEQLYNKKNLSVLISKFESGPENIAPGCFGVLLTVLTLKSIKI